MSQSMKISTILILGLIAALCLITISSTALFAYVNG